MNTLDQNLDEALQLFNAGDFEVEKRHPSTHHMLRVLAPNPKLPNHLFYLSNSFFGLGLQMVMQQTDGPELTAGLRKLMEAKDCFVRNDLDTDPVNYNDR